MNKYEITSTTTINQGARISLSKEQAEPRKTMLREVGKGVYEVVSRVQFKVGEKIGYDGDLPRNLATLMQKEGGNEGPTVKELQEKLTAMGISIPVKANKAALLKLLEESEKAAADKAAAAAAAEAAKKQAALKAKALELAGIEANAFDALPPAEQDQWLAKAEEALEQQ